jgi:hypothetical protein
MMHRDQFGHALGGLPQVPSHFRSAPAQNAPSKPVSTIG